MLIACIKKINELIKIKKDVKSQLELIDYKLNNNYKFIYTVACNDNLIKLLHTIDGETLKIELEKEILERGLNNTQRDLLSSVFQSCARAKIKNMLKGEE